MKAWQQRSFLFNLFCLLNRCNTNIFTYNLIKLKCHTQSQRTTRMWNVRFQLLAYKLSAVLITKHLRNILRQDAPLLIIEWNGCIIKITETIYTPYSARTTSYYHWGISWHASLSDFQRLSYVFAQNAYNYRIVEMSVRPFTYFVDFLKHGWSYAYKS
jgi:hypothetical protein